MIYLLQIHNKYQQKLGERERKREREREREREDET